jgi:methionyl-tRNA synthetase
MDQAIELAPSDTWRWHLMANAPEGSDAAFTWEEFQSSVNSDLANVLGNFVNRITKYTVSKFDAQLPAGGEPGEHEDWVVGEVNARLAVMIEHFEAREFRKALNEMRAIWAAGNEYLTRSAPWTHYKTDVDQAAVGVRMGLNLVALFGIIAQPVIPNAAGKILDAMSIPDENRGWGRLAGWEAGLPIGLGVTSPDVLFAKIEDDDVTAWADRFGGGSPSS